MRYPVASASAALSFSGDSADVDDRTTFQVSGRCGGNRRRRNVALIGLGLHATKAYLPIISSREDVRVAVVIDVTERLDIVHERLRPFLSDSFSPMVIGVPAFTKAMPLAVATELDLMKAAQGLDAAIISTDPESHGAYLRWAVRNGLSILVDKPVLGAPNATVEPGVASNMMEEFKDILGMVAAKPEILVSVAVQREWHPAFIVLRSLVADAAARFHCPVTGISSSHGDGQLRFPHEIGQIKYHGYLDGIGKTFHSLYHELQVQAGLIEAAARASGMTYDTLVTKTSTIRPRGFLKQLPRPVWESIFGSGEWGEACPAPDEQMLEQYRNYGELDVTATTDFLTGGDTTLLATVEGRHNTFSRRSWLEPTKDLYKRMGRTKHEQHTVHQGPFQTIHVTSWQSKDRHELNTAADYEPGGNSHLTIDVFRNADLWPSGTPVMETIDASKIAANAGLSADRLLMSHAKDSMLENFLANVTGTRALHDNPSDIRGHLLAMQLLANVAESAASGTAVETPAPIDTP